LSAGVSFNIQQEKLYATNKHLFSICGSGHYVGITGFATTVDANDAALSVAFTSLEVVKIQVGEFHFRPGQAAPLHTHAAPAFGYVSKGAILYQVEGRDAQLLQTGEVYYEPAGPRIMRFDNASLTEEVIFFDINLQGEGEPFIVFEQPPTENIDRRALPETTYENVRVDGIDIFDYPIQPDAKQAFNLDQPISTYVAEGVVEVRIKGEKTRTYKAGDLFYAYKPGTGVVFVNKSSEAAANVIVFALHKAP
jgi:quercetin dioxygenase-like cupin family protein